MGKYILGVLVDTEGKNNTARTILLILIRVELIKCIGSPCFFHSFVLFLLLFFVLRCGHGNPQDVHTPKEVEFFAQAPREYPDSVRKKNTEEKDTHCCLSQTIFVMKCI